MSIYCYTYEFTSPHCSQKISVIHYHYNKQNKEMMQENEYREVSSTMRKNKAFLEDVYKRQALEGSWFLTSCGCLVSIRMEMIFFILFFKFNKVESLVLVDSEILLPWFIGGQICDCVLR